MTGNELKAGRVIRLMMGIACLAMAGGTWAQGDTAKPAEPATAPEASEAPAGTAGAAATEEMQNLKGSVESLNESYLETKTTVDKLSKIKVSGYVQAQWQYADSIGIQSVAGGNFPPTVSASGNNQVPGAGTQQRFQVRRGRLKTAYETATSRYVLQIDAIPSGVTLKDAYVTLMEPWLKTFSYTMGVFDRPFGFEISYSSGSRESPERSRVFQTLFPGERDLGARLDITPPAELGFLQYLNFRGGVFTGMGGTANEIDNEQDFIGRLGFQAPFYDLNLSLDGGFSAYLGSVTNVGDTAFAVGTGSAGNPTWMGTGGHARETFDRHIMGADAQLYYDLPILGGFSLRGEYLWGKHPTSRTSTSVYTGTAAPTPQAPSPSAPFVAEREVMGWYVNLVQNLGKSVQAVVKYDYFDPNTEVEGDDVGRSGSNLAAADLAVATWGFGLLYYWDENLRFTAYYDMVANEEANADIPALTSSGAANAAYPWRNDLPDNVFTFRAQVRF